MDSNSYPDVFSRSLAQVLKFRMLPDEYHQMEKNQQHWSLMWGVHFPIFGILEK